MARKGRSLEILISHLEGQLHQQPGVSVESPKFLIDRVTGNKREHDVVITFQHEHHEILVAIECRDRTVKIDSSHVEAFVGKCEDTGINKGIMVSPKGFTKPALKKASHSNISCFDISQATSFNWLYAPGINVVYKRILNTEVIVNPKKDPRKKPTVFQVVDINGNELTKDIIKQNICNFLNKEKGMPPPGVYDRVIVFGCKNLYIKISGKKKTLEVKDVVAKVKIEVVEELKPFNLVEYKDIESNTIISTAAVADIDIEPFKGKAIMVYDKEKGGTLSLIKTE